MDGEARPSNGLQLVKSKSVKSRILLGGVSIKSDDELAGETQGRRQKLTVDSRERKDRDFFFIHPSKRSIQIFPFRSEFQRRLCLL